MSEAPTPDTYLAPEGEAQWTRLRRHLELSDGFWLAFVFARSIGSVRILEQRTERILQQHARKQIVLRSSSPEELANVTQRVLELAETERAGADALGCIWVEAVFADAPGLTDGPWETAWEQTLLALNQARERLRERLNAGLAICAPADVKANVRAVAPDLWSIRTLVLDIPAARALLPPRHRVDRAIEPRETGLSVALGPVALSLDDLRGSPNEEAAREVLDEIHQIERLASADHSTEAVEWGHAAIARARGLAHPGLLAGALAAVGVIERANDPAAAAGHLTEAVELLRGASDADAAFTPLLGQLGELAVASGDLAQAVVLFDEQVTRLRALIGAYGETPQALRDLSISLNGLGDTYQDAGNTTAAKAAYEESLTLARQLLDTHGETPQTLRDLFISLYRLGYTYQDAGNTTAAKAAYEESLTLARQLLDTYGETPQTLRDLFISLDKLGDTYQVEGDTTAAKAAYEESHALARQLLDTYGETPQALRDLVISLDKLGDMYQDEGNTTATRSAYKESHTLARQLLDTYGETPQTLRDLSISLDRLGDLHQDEGNIAAAKTAYEESHTLSQRLLDTCGETPQTLRDLSISLNNLGDTQYAEGNLAAAKTAYEESHTLTRRVLDTYGETPQALADLAFVRSRLEGLGEAEDAEEPSQR